jgi:hypothetical protein
MEERDLRVPHPIDAAAEGISIYSTIFVDNLFGANLPLGEFRWWDRPRNPHGGADGRMRSAAEVIIARGVVINHSFMSSSLLYLAPLCVRRALVGTRGTNIIDPLS